jgi:hypothetical protein
MYMLALPVPVRIANLVKLEHKEGGEGQIS